MISIKNIGLIWFSRFLSMAASLAILPIVFKELGEESFILVLFFQALYSWIQLSDIGTATRNRNLIHNKENVRYIINSIISLFLLLTPAYIVVIAFCLYIDVFSLYDVANKFNEYFIIFIIIFISGYSEQFVKILYSRGVRNKTSIIAVLGSIFTLLYTYFVKLDNIVEFISIFYLPAFFGRCYIFFKEFSDEFLELNFSCKLALDNVNKSKKFFLISLLGVIAFHSLPLISKVILPVKELAGVLLLHRLYFSGYSLFSSVIQMYWPTFTLHFKNKELKTVEMKMKRIILFFFFAILSSSLLLFFYQNIIIKILAPESNYYFTPTLIFYFASFYLLRIFTDVHFVFFQSMDETSVILRTLPIQALLSVFLQYILGMYFSTEGLMLGAVISLIPTAYFFNKKSREVLGY